MACKSICELVEGFSKFVVGLLPSTPPCRGQDVTLTGPGTSRRSFLDKGCVHEPMHEAMDPYSAGQLAAKAGAQHEDRLSVFPRLRTLSFLF